MNLDKAEDCGAMIYLLGLVHQGKLKYEYVMSFYSYWVVVDLFAMLSQLDDIGAQGIKREMMYLLNFCAGWNRLHSMSSAWLWGKAQDKHGSRLKQVVRFCDDS